MATQSERREATRLALLDAAADRLVAEGLAGFTTAGVASQAGLSSGALFGRFPTRLALLVETVEHVLTRLRVDYGTLFGSLGGSTVSPRTLLEMLWVSMSDPQLAAVFEIYAQARTDTELLALLNPIVATHRDHVNGLIFAVVVGFDGYDTDSMVAVVDLAVSALQGLVISQMSGLGFGDERDLIDTLVVQIEATRTPADRT